jgi:hypothetical protein
MVDFVISSDPSGASGLNIINVNREIGKKRLTLIKAVSSKLDLVRKPISSRSMGRYEFVSQNWLAPKTNNLALVNYGIAMASLELGHIMHTVKEHSHCDNLQYCM